MQFSDTSTGQGLIQDCEFLTGLDRGTISGTTQLLEDFTRMMNIHYHRVVTMVLKSHDGWDFDDSNHLDFPILTTPLTLNRDYQIPVSEKVLKIKRLDVSWDGQVAYEATPFDINESGLGYIFDLNEDQIDGRFNKTEPAYDTLYGSIMLFPRADQVDIDAGGKLQITWSREIDEFTTADTTQEPGFDEPFHRMLSLGASFDYAKVRQLPMANDLFALLSDYEARLKEYYGKKQEHRNYVLRSAFQDME